MPTSFARVFPQPARSLREVAENVVASTDADYFFPFFLKEFIDHLIREARAGGAVPSEPLPISEAAFRDEPPPLANAIHRTYLAGMAEHLATLSGQPVPAWCQRDVYVLAEPVVRGGPRSRDLMIAQTPPAFARRNLYCGPALEKFVKLLGLDG